MAKVGLAKHRGRRKLGRKKRGFGAKVASTQSLKSRTKGRYGLAPSIGRSKSSMNGWD